MNKRAVCVTVLVISLLLSSSAANSQVPKDDLSNFLSRYGNADLVKTDQFDKPPPPIPTRTLIYRKQNVRAVFVPDASIGAHPPYKKWKLLYFADEKTTRHISSKEAEKRLRKRLRKTLN